MSKTSRRTLSSFSSNRDFAANDFSFAAIFFSVLQSSLNYIMIKGNILRKVKISINRGKKNHKLFDRKGKLSLDGDCTDLVHVLLSFIKKIRRNKWPEISKFLLKEQNNDIHQQKNIEKFMR